jgi:hypothetical protein
MQYSDRLQSIKECDLVSIIKEIADGETVNIDVVMDDVEWLIEQAEKVEKVGLKGIKNFEDDAEYYRFYLKDCEAENVKLREKIERYENALKAILNISGDDIWGTRLIAYKTLNNL